jgi:hypothetical protein
MKMLILVCVGCDASFMSISDAYEHQEEMNPPGSKEHHGGFDVFEEEVN